MVDKAVRIEPRGPYLVKGNIPLVRKTPVMSEYGEPLTWKKLGLLKTGELYLLCRCGGSMNKPFCDGTHESRFDGDESEADNTAPIATRHKQYRGVGITLKDDHSLCAGTGFCGNRVTNVWQMISKTEDTQVRAQLMSMIERCPSGTLVYSVNGDSEEIEPDLPVEIAIIVDGPIWVSGGLPIQRSDGSLLEKRNRITLCRCGASDNKPFCDGSHARIGFHD